MDSTTSLATSNNVTAESLATLACLSGEDSEGTMNGVFLKTHLGILQSKPRAEQSKVHHEFAAKYLPAAAEKYRQSADAWNPSLSLMNLVGHTPYFVRFAQSPVGRGIAALQAERMAAVSSDTMDVDRVGEMCQFLSTVLVLQGPSDVEDADKSALVPKLRTWTRAYRGRFAAETSDRCLGILTDEPASRAVVQMVKSGLERGVGECGAQGCSRRQRASGSELLKCARCKTAVYCGAEHQKQAWSTHKAACFPAAF